MDRGKHMFYKIVQSILKGLFLVLYHPTIIGKDFIPNEGPFVLAGNHTNWKDPLFLISVCKSPIHFLAKDSLFHGIIGIIVKKMGCIPVNRSIHDKDALNSAKDCLLQKNVIGIFPEGTINRSNAPILPFKIGAVKMSKDTNSLLVPFVITGKYHIFGKSIQIEFLNPRKITKNLTIENNSLMKEISNKREAIYERH